MKEYSDFEIIDTNHIPKIFGKKEVVKSYDILRPEKCFSVENYFTRAEFVQNILRKPLSFIKHLIKYGITIHLNCKENLSYLENIRQSFWTHSATKAPEHW